MCNLKILLTVAIIVGCAYAHHDDHHLHCHHDADDTIHLRMGESQTLKGTCILVTCKDPDTNLLEETRCVDKTSGESYETNPRVIDAPYPECCI